MQTIPISAIKIAPNRQRQEFDPQALMELSESISDRGLLHAPVLREVDGEFWLVAGERRLRAITDLDALGQGITYNSQLVPPGHIPYVTLGELDPLEAEEAELDENLRRRDLSWQEHAAAVERLHELRGKQFKNDQIIRQAAGLLSEKECGLCHTIADTAEELTGRRDGAYQAKTRKEILVARHLDDPDIAKAKTLDEGFKLLKRKEEAKKNEELADIVGRTFSSDAIQLIHGCCLSWMASADPEQFDVILTDPPYGMGADQFSDGGGKFTGISHQYDDSPEAWRKLMLTWAPLSFRIAKPEAHAYVWCDFDHFHELKAIMGAAGWYVFRTPLINVKAGSGRVPLPEHGPRRQYEICLYAIKGKKKVTYIYPDVITSTADTSDGHGATKPISLYSNLLQRSCRPGDRILDSFAGSGPIIPAAFTAKCSAVVIEQEANYYGMCLKRLEELEK